MTEVEKQRLIALGYDPSEYSFADEADTNSVAIKPLPNSLNTSAPGAFTRSVLRGTFPSLAAGAGAFGVGSLLEGTGVGAPIGIPLQIFGAGLAGFGARKAQEEIAPKIIPSYIESEQQDIQEHPLSSTLGTISSSVAG